MTARLTLALAAILSLHVPAMREPPGDGQASKDDRGYVKVLVEIEGQLSPIPAPGDRASGFVRVGDGFGLQVFRLDWSAAPELREQAKKMPYHWVLLTGTLKAPGPDSGPLGNTGTVTVKTLKEASKSKQGGK